MIVLYTKRRTNAPDNLLEKSSSYHPNIKLTVDENPHHFLGASSNHQEGNFTTRVYQKPGKKVKSDLFIKIFNLCNWKEEASKKSGLQRDSNS